MKIASKIGKESSITFSGLLYGNLNRYIYTAMLARWVGPEFLGIYSLANAKEVSSLVECILKNMNYKRRFVFDKNYKIDNLVDKFINNVIIND